MSPSFQAQFRFFSFAGVEVNVQTHEIRDAGGVSYRLVGKPFDVLVYLAIHHERFCTSEELSEEFWGDESNLEEGFDPQNVYKAVQKIRRVLGDPTCIITERQSGFRIKRPVTFHDEASILPKDVPPLILPEVPIRHTPWPIPPKNTRFRVRHAMILLSVSALLVGAVILFIPQLSPKVIDSVALTHTGFPKFAPVISSGQNLYFTEVVYGRYNVMTLNRVSDEISLVPTTVPNPYLCDLSPDRKSMLLRSVTAGFDDYGSLFVQSLDSNLPAEPLPITALDGVWSHDGRTIVYTRGSDLSIFDLASKASKVIARVDGFAWWPRWAPDAKGLRFTVSDAATQLTTIWEVRADGSNLHRLFNPRDKWFHAGSGSWSQDGRYFVFQVGPLLDSKLWILNEGGFALFGKQEPNLLSPEASLRGPAFGVDARTILARSQVARATLRKINPITGAQIDFPSQSIAEMAAYSPDGQSMAYCISSQEQSLWVAKSDGGSSRRLIGPPLQTAFPQWSPQGDRIALVTRRFDGTDPWRITIVTVKTGQIERFPAIPMNALHPNWSRDGKKLLFGTIPTLNQNAYLYELDLESKKPLVVPGSQGLFTPAWSPNGRYIVALKADSYELEILDMITGIWNSVPGQKFGYPIWSSDNRFVYTFRNDGGGPRFYRVDVDTRIPKEFLYLQGFKLADRWIGLDPDGSLLAAQNAGLQEIVALELDRPVDQ